MAPKDFIEARDKAKTIEDEFYVATVDGRPYFPNLTVDPADEATVKRAALAIVLLSSSANGEELPAGSKSALSDDLPLLNCAKVTGGITNALFRVSGFLSLDKAPPYDSVLLRIFGAEGMIDRDVETSTYAALCDVGVAYRYLGRFGNGRAEGWLEGYRPLDVSDLADEATSLGIAREMAKLHCRFQVPDQLKEHHGEVGVWDQLNSWMAQAKGYDHFKTQEDTDRVRQLNLSNIQQELSQIITSFSEGAEAGAIAFCHNDLLAANIMRHAETGHVQLIDFEYGGTNYAAFDLANHFNEHAGGTSAEENGTTDYSRFPDDDRQSKFVLEYVETMRQLRPDGGEGKDANEEALEVRDQVQKFILVNHLYWGLWAVNQAAEEGCEDFDYINYATNRFKEFYSKSQNQ